MSVIRVFISYSHDSDEHCKRVLELSERLRQDGIETSLDQYVNGSPPGGWPRWMLDQLDWAEFVLVVCTDTYYRRFRGHEKPGVGMGADWEGALITQEIYESRSTTLKFVPIFASDVDRKCVPEPLRSITSYDLTKESGYEQLYDFLLGQAGVAPGPVGIKKSRPRRTGKALEYAVASGSAKSGKRGLLGTIIASLVAVPVIGWFFQQGRLPAREPSSPENDSDSLLYAADHTADPVEAALLLQELGATASDALAPAAQIRRRLAGQTLPIASLDHPDAVSYAEFSPDRTQILTNCSDSCIRVWRVDGRSEPVVLAHAEPVKLCSFSPSGRWLITATSGVFFVWDYTTPARTTLSLPLYADTTSRASDADPNIPSGPKTTSSITLAPRLENAAGRNLAMGRDDRFFALWGNGAVTIGSFASARTIARIDCHAEITSLAFSPRSDKFVMLTRDLGGTASLEILSVDENRVASLFRADGLRQVIANVNADTVAIQGNEAVVRLIDVNSVKESASYPIPENATLTGLSNGTPVAKVRWGSSKGTGLGQAPSFEEAVFLPSGEVALQASGSYMPHYELGEFSPDGRFLIFKNPVRGFASVKSVDHRIDTTEMTKLFIGFGDYHFSSDGKTVGVFGPHVAHYSVPEMLRIACIDGVPGSKVLSISLENGLCATSVDLTRVDVWWISRSKPLRLMGALEEQLKELRDATAGVLSVEARRRLLSETMSDAIRRHTARSRALRVNDPP